MSKYTDLKEKQQKEINAFPIAFAFGEKRFKEVMEQLGLTPNDTDKVCSLYGAGDIFLKKDVPAYLAMLRRHKKELQDAIASDKTGEGFIYEMFSTELADHEYCVSCDLTDTLNALGLSVEDVNSNKALMNGLHKAAKEQMEWYLKGVIQ